MRLSLLGRMRTSPTRDLNRNNAHCLQWAGPAWLARIESKSETHSSRAAVDGGRRRPTHGVGPPGVRRSLYGKVDRFLHRAVNGDLHLIGADRPASVRLGKRGVDMVFDLADFEAGLVDLVVRRRR